MTNELKLQLREAFLAGIAFTRNTPNKEYISCAFTKDADKYANKICCTKMYRYEITTEDMTIISHKTFSTSNEAQIAAIEAYETCKIVGSKIIKIVEI